MAALPHCELVSFLCIDEVADTMATCIICLVKGEAPEREDLSIFGTELHVGP